jgi:hypothetical protein
VVSIEVNLTSEAIADESASNHQRRITNHPSKIDNEFVAWTLDLGPLVRCRNASGALPPSPGPGFISKRSPTIN